MIQIQYKDMSAGISPMGAQLITFCKNGRNLLWGRDKAVWGESAPLLFPICGRLREGTYYHKKTAYTLPAHGFAKTSHFTLILHTAAKAVLELKSSQETLACYPFPFALRAVYELTEQGLEFAFEVENTATTPMYYSCGGHWGVALEEDLSAYCLAFDQSVDLKREKLDGAFLSGHQESVATQGRRLPLGYQICDNDTYVFKNAPRACTLMRGEQPVVRLEYPDSPHLLLWTLPGQKFICIEPWNGMPDGKESREIRDKDSIEVLEGGKTARIRHRILPL